MTKQPQPTWEKPDLASVPLFTAFGDATDSARPGRVRSGFTLSPAVAAPPTPSSLHVVGREAKVGPMGPPSEYSPEVDWDEASELRALASKRFYERAAQSAFVDETSRQELGRAVIMEVVQEATEARFAVYGSVSSATAQDALAQAVFDLMFGLGRLQPLVDRADVENIIVVGHDRVFLDRHRGRSLRATGRTKRVAASGAAVATGRSRIAMRRGRTPSPPRRGPTSEGQVRAG